MFSKKEYQRKCQEEQEANGRVFQDFLETFQTDVSTVKVKAWVKAGSFDAGTGREDETEKGIIYEPKPLIKGHHDQLTTVRNAIECARIIKDKKIERTSARKHTTNLEALKEEIKQRHIERQKVKEAPPVAATVGDNEVVQDILDPNSTNLYIGNIHPKLTENDLIQMFGAYGPLASVKIMWPRGEDNANRNSHCGFVAYMSRKDAERAYDAMKTTEIKVSWGKFVEVPQYPIYIPSALLALTQPPPNSGLPFNAQPISGSCDESNLSNTVVKVSIPADKKLISVIHRVIEFVIREGPLFEAMIMNREIKNPVYKFLFENNSAAHTYYRWKLFSVMNGEAVKTWSKKPFRMFSGGSIWIPPTSLDYSKGMPEHLLTTTKRTKSPRLSETQCKRFIRFVRELSLTRPKIGETMVFCLNHADCAGEIVECITESFRNSATNAQKKLARLFLISDVLCNCNGKGSSRNHSFRTGFERGLPEIFEHMHRTLTKMKYSCDREAFKTRVSKTLRQWELLKIYPDEYLNRLETLLLSGNNANVRKDDDSDADSDVSESLPEPEDGNLNDPLPKPEKSNPNNEFNPGFVPSRWETVDPDEVEAQSMSTKKFYDMEIQRKKAKQTDVEPVGAKIPNNNSNTVSQKRSDKKRKRLRELEVLVMQFQDELETGHKKLRKDSTLEKEVTRYRARLMKDLEKSDHSSETSPEEKETEDKKDRSKGGSRTSNSSSSKKVKTEKRRRHKH